jgi:HPr serine kinase-like protein
LTRGVYRHNGFTLSCNESLDRLAAAPTGATPDINVHALAPGELPSAELPWVMVDPPIASRADTEQGSALRLRYAMDSEWAEFVIDERGDSVSVSRARGIAFAEVAELLLGPVFSCVLAQRGLTCLHAATVNIAGRVVAIAGPSGAGKSTTALALVQRGGALIADDVAVLDEDPARPTVRSGAPRLRMRPDSAASLVGSYAELESMWIHEDRRPHKRYVQVDESTAVAGDTTWPLDVMYLLVADAGATAPALTTLSPAQALARLMPLRHMAGALDAGAHRRDFQKLARLSEAVPVRELTRPQDLSSAPATVAAILADLEQLD